MINDNELLENLRSSLEEFINTDEIFLNQEMNFRCFLGEIENINRFFNLWVKVKANIIIVLEQVFHVRNVEDWRDKAERVLRFCTFLQPNYLLGHEFLTLSMYRSFLDSLNSTITLLIADLPPTQRKKYSHLSQNNS